MKTSSPPQTNCQPLPGWQFTLGTGYESRAVTGDWGSLSKVTGAYDTSIVTQDSTPLLDDDASPVPDTTVAGATTIELTDAQRAQANNPDQLWAQGGTPTDPVLAQMYPGPEYGFGTLRCATDNLNGDNVEFIYFPAGRAPRVLLRVLRQAAADHRADHDPEARHRGSRRYQPVVPIQRRHLVRPERIRADQRRLDRLLARRRIDLDCDRGAGRRLQPRLDQVHRGERGWRPGPEHDHDRPSAAAPPRSRSSRWST